MTRTSILVAVALAITSLLSGCHGESITNPSTGNHVLSGQVVPVGDLAGSSPAGINVSCSGQVGMTDAAGRFTFVGLPGATGQYTILSTGAAAGTLQLVFSRADGISASGSVSGDASSVLVNLQKKQAAIVVTGQSGGNGGGQTQELEGLITAVSDMSITVNNASTGGHVTAAITGNTVIRRGNTRLAAKDLKVGDQVHVKTVANGDGTLTATEIMLQNPAN